MASKTATNRSDGPGNNPDVLDAVATATRRLLSDRRLDELTVVDLIREARVSRASFYAYFESKHAAVAALAEEVMEEIHALWSPWLAGEEETLTLESIWLESIALWREQQAVLMAAAEAWRADATAGGAWGAMMKRYADSVYSYIERARAEGRAPREPDARTLATVLVLLNESSLYRAFDRASPPPENDCRLAETLSAVWRRAIHEGMGPVLDPIADAASGPHVSTRPRPADAGRRRSAGNPEVRQAFIDATARLLQQRRLEDLTVVDLIEAAGYSRPTFYEYFGSKHAVVAALASEVMTEVWERLWRPIFEADGPMTRELWTAQYLETLATWREHQAVLGAAAEGWRSDPVTYHEWGVWWQSYVTTIAQYIERARATGTAPSRPDAEALAEMLVWLSETVLYLAHAETPCEIGSDADLAATMSAVWLRSVHETTEPLND